MFTGLYVYIEAGSKLIFPLAVVTQAWAPVGMHKYHSFMEYVQLYPEYDFIFLGDNGQGDAMCADRVIEKSGMFRHILRCIGYCAASSSSVVFTGMHPHEHVSPSSLRDSMVCRLPCWSICKHVLWVSVLGLPTVLKQCNHFCVHLESGICSRRST